MHVKSCCFAHKTSCFFTLSSSSWLRKLPNAKFRLMTAKKCQKFFSLRFDPYLFYPELVIPWQAEVSDAREVHYPTKV